MGFATIGLAKTYQLLLMYKINNMKNTIKFISTLIIILTLISNRINAKDSNSDSVQFAMNGKILQSVKEPGSKCKIELFYGNTVIDSMTIKMNKPFKFNLKKNAWYTLRVTQTGCLPLLISFNTELKNGTPISENTFSFETQLIKLEDAKNMNQEFIDFPIGLVELNVETGKFETTEEFTSNYFTTLNKNSKVIYSDLAISIK